MHQFGISTATQVIFDTPESSIVQSQLPFGWKVSSNGIRRTVNGNLPYTCLVRILLVGERIGPTDSFTPSLIPIG